MMAELSDGLEQLQAQLRLVNEEYPLLVRSTGDKARLPRMAELSKMRLDLMTSILTLERFRRPAG
jgi:hypothetical protein